MTSEEKQAQFWKSLLQSVEVEPRTATSIRGASGFNHPVVGVGVDDKRKRVVIISGEADARYAALAYGDIQAAMPALKVMMARPVAVNLALVAKFLTEMLGRVSITESDIGLLKRYKENDPQTDALAKPVIDVLTGLLERTIGPAKLNTLATIKEVINQLALIEVENKDEFMEGGRKDGTTPFPNLNLKKLVVLDPAEADKRMGLCSVPIYNFSSEEVHIFHSGVDIEAAREILLRQGIFQYFFPAPDQLALGFADRSPSTPTQIVDSLLKTPMFGHPYGQAELITQSPSIAETVDALRDLGYLVEGEIGVELSESGRNVRAQVKFKPREGLITKLLERFSFNVDLSLKDLLK